MNWIIQKSKIVSVLRYGQINSQNNTGLNLLSTLLHININRKEETAYSSQKNHFLQSYVGSKTHDPSFSMINKTDGQLNQLDLK